MHFGLDGWEGDGLLCLWSSAGCEEDIRSPEGTVEDIVGKVEVEADTKKRQREGKSRRINEKKSFGKTAP